MAELGVGLIGTGFMGKCHALAWRSVHAIFGAGPKPRLEVLCDVPADRAAAFADQFGFGRSTDDWRVLVNDPAVDVVSITAPNALHKEIAIAALEAGKHVWCEKPMALTLSDAEEMAAAARSAPGIALLGYNYIRNPAVQNAKRLIDEGTIGRVFEFRGKVDEDYMASPDLPWSWRCRLSEAGLGVVGDLTCHMVSIAKYLIGDIASLTADIETVHRQRPLPDRPGETDAVENEDVAHALIRFVGGQMGTLSSSRVLWGRKSGLVFEVHGSKGTITFDQERMNELQLYVSDGAETARGFRTIFTGPVHPPYSLFCPAPGHGLGFNDLKVIEASHLLCCIGQQCRPFIGFEDGLKIERVIHGIVESARSRQWISVA